MKCRPLGFFLACAVFVPTLCAQSTLTTTTTTKTIPVAKESPDVQLRLQLDRSKIRPGSKKAVYAVSNLEVVGGDKPDRKPLALSIVLDVSGSMRGENKLKHVVEATEFILDRLGKDDRVAILSYSTGTNEVYIPDGAPDAEEARRELGRLKPQGGTNMEAGIRLGLKHLEGLGVENAARRLLVLSDGQANQGISSIEGLSKIVKEGSKKVGASVSSFGVGADYNEDLMAAIAEAAGGNYHVIDRGAELAEVFQKEFDELGSLVGSQVRLKLDLPKGLELKEAIGYTLEGKGKDQVVVLRDLFYGMKTKVVLKLAPLSTAPKKGKGTLTQTLTFADAQTAEERQTTASASFEWTDTLAREKESANEDLISIVEELEGARELDLASRAYASGDAAKAKAILQGRIDRNLSIHGTSAGSDSRLLEQNSVLKKVMTRFKSAPTGSRAGRAAVKWSKQNSRQYAY